LLDWQLPEEELKAACERLRDLFDRALPVTSEASLEEELIRPILSDVLGFSYLVQPSTSIFKTHRKPDYALFLTEEEKQAAKPFDGEKKLFANALAVADAKAWEVDLDTIGPASQMHDYILISNVRWGMITNGRRWRLYQRDTVHELDTFYEVDLEKIIAADDLSSLKYFLVFFHAQSFLRNSFLDRVLTESVEYARRVGAELKENVFEALRLLCQGFLDGNQDLSAEGLPAIHENGLILLYRVLFLLYAESDQERELLPLSHPEYREQIGLCALKREVAEQRVWLPETHNLWGRFRDLFHLIHSGSERLGIYEYNGGLFDPERYPFLERHVIGDRYLAEALRLLTCTQAEGHRGFLDYSALDVRELGSVYEGLLEHKLILREEELSWERDKSQRKKTGSYYTPEYIVSYIVGETLGPLVDEIKQGLKEERTALEGEIHRARGENRRLLEQQRDDLLKKARERVLDLKVLDPAMGSGHFLVSACDYLARRIAELEAELTEKETEEAVQELKRTVAIRCLHGVDLNPLATELAKLSLWLHTVAKGKPLSFLDHHLRTGNSLIGVTVRELERPPSGKPGEIGLWESKIREELGKAIRHLAFIKEATSDSRTDIEAKKKHWELVNTWIGKYKQAANVWLSTRFGSKVSDGDYQQVLETAAGGKLDQVAAASFFHKAQEIAVKKRFFHWELEFPDVFFDRFGRPLANPGFDAVIGNPPYGSISDKVTKNWVQQQYQSSGTTLDTFAMFLERAIQLATVKGVIGEIVPSGWLTAREHLPIRTVVLSRTYPKKIIYMPYNVFPAAYIDTVIWVSKKRDIGAPSESFEVLVKRFGHHEKAELTLQQLKDYQIVQDPEWFSDPQRLIITDTGPGQWLGEWISSARFVPVGKLLSLSRGITPFAKPISGETRNTFLGFFGSVNRYALELGEFAPVVYDSYLAEYKPIKFFIGPRLIIRRIISRQHRIHAALVTESFMINKSYLPAIAATDKYSLTYVLASINSNLLSLAFFARSEIAKRDDFPQLDIATVRELPIRRIAFVTPKEERERLVEEGKRLYSEALGSLRLEGEVRSLDDKLNRR